MKICRTCITGCFQGMKFWQKKRQQQAQKYKGETTTISRLYKNCIGCIRKLVISYMAFFFFLGGIWVYYVLSPVQELPMLANQVFLTYPLFPWCFLKGSKHAQRKMNVKKKSKTKNLSTGGLL